EKAGWSVNDVDLYEVNEAFACVAMIAMRDLGIPHEKINVNGGATALGHPIGASGARITTTLIAALQERGLKRGVASLCIGGGEATAIAVELVSSLIRRVSGRVIKAASLERGEKANAFDHLRHRGTCVLCLLRPGDR